MITFKEEMVKIKSNSGSLPPEKHVEEGEYQVQHSPEHHGDHLHAEKGRDKVQHNQAIKHQQLRRGPCLYQAAAAAAVSQID